jgi:hypothetical protein
LQKKNNKFGIGKLYFIVEKFSLQDKFCQKNNNIQQQNMSHHENWELPKTVPYKLQQKPQILKTQKIINKKKILIKRRKKTTL